MHLVKRTSTRIHSGCIKKAPVTADSATAKKMTPPERLELSTS
ncbi:hypothetical protein JI435_417240 [Parastagonospora nodorum SN15]|uniref:Uncharacterized protein n=1 Tax=Phaeosphaeria nodorum (strain SN15 / ATCC MYA-4574 / FGSC 10173) TaxID=321614 RepID=A0A7U2I704_PHANO|nr:hypothetical protein JI435_417240 [Parastagonospora nodorum SN15]